MQITIPGLTEEIGAGDVVKAVLEKVGIKQNGDCGCLKRQQAMNRAFTFRPVAATVERVGLVARIGSVVDFPLSGSIVAGAIPPGLTFNGRKLVGELQECGRWEMTVEHAGRREQLTVIAEA